MTMPKNSDQIVGKWKQIVGEAKKKWGELTDDELLQIHGDREILAGTIQEKYGIAKEDALQQIDQWIAQLKE